MSKQLRAEATGHNNPVTCLKFSYDGFKLLAVVKDTIYVINAFSGDLINKFSTSMAAANTSSTYNLPLKDDTNGFNRKIAKEAAFTPDGKFVISGRLTASSLLYLCVC